MNENRQLVSSSSPYENRLGFSRAVRIGSTIAVSGTAPIGLTARSTIEDQARRCFAIISEALAQAGATLSDVIRTRIYLLRIEDWEIVSAVHGELFREIRPATTVVQVSRFIDPSWLVEIEADAQLDKPPVCPAQAEGTRND